MVTALEDTLLSTDCILLLQVSSWPLFIIVSVHWKCSAQENTKTAVTVLFTAAKLWKNTIIELKSLHKLGLHKIEWYSALKTGKLTSHKKHI